MSDKNSWKADLQRPMKERLLIVKKTIKHNQKPTRSAHCHKCGPCQKTDYLKKDGGSPLL